MADINLKSFFKKRWRLISVVFLALIFFAGTASFNYFTQKPDFIKWLSPDETANYVFTKLYSQENDLRIYERYNLYARDIMHPRSFLSDRGKMKPVSFLGLILIYGQIGAWTTYRIIPYLTPIFSALGLVFFYLLVKRIFGPRNAFISVFLLAAFPVYIYYSSRSMFHNTLFVVLLAIGLYYSVLMAKAYPPPKAYGGWLKAGAAGLSVGMAVAVRTSELIWLVPVFFVVWLFYLREIGLAKLLIFISGAVLALLPVFYWNQILYDSPFYGGYPAMNNSIAGLAESGAGLAGSALTGNLAQINAWLVKIKDYIFYFGFNPAQSAKMLYYYFARMFPWLFVASGLGAIIYYSRLAKIKKKHVAYLIGYLLMSASLIFYYGSWRIHDNPDPGSFTIGNSYTRYWLPVYLGALPLASYFLMSATRRIVPKKLFTDKEKTNERGSFWLKPTFYVKSLRFTAVAAIILLSVNFTLFGSAEGLWYAAGRQKEARAERDLVLEKTENNAVIITEYHDKLFFPERKVIVGRFNDDNMNDVYAVLADRLPVYYYNFTFPIKDLDYLNNNKLKKADLQIAVEEKITPDFTLYRLRRAETGVATTSGQIE